METQMKWVLGGLAAVVVGYLVFKPKPAAQASAEAYKNAKLVSGRIGGPITTNARGLVVPVIFTFSDGLSNSVPLQILSTDLSANSNVVDEITKWITGRAGEGITRSELLSMAATYPVAIDKTAA